MKTFMPFPVCSLLFISLVAIVYFLKPHIKTIENKIYRWLVISNILGLILEILCYFAVDLVTSNYIISIFILKAYVIYIFVWSMIFNLYVFLVSHKNYGQKDNNLDKYFQKIKKITIILTTVFSTIMFLLPIKIFNEGGLTYTYGPITNLLLILCFIIVSSWVFICISHYKDLKQKRYIPIIACVLILTLVLLVQSYDRSILIATTGHSFIVLLMFFTIENPDVKMIEELNKNRLLVNKTTEEKSNFLFLASNQIKDPIKKILNISSNALEENSEMEFKESLKQINNLSHDLAFTVDNVMDISTLTINNIKVVNHKYNLFNLIQKIKIVKEKEINENIEFRLNLSPNIPNYLYGDSKLLEQVLNSVLDNSIKYTKKGFIELNISTIIKYDMCRLLITIEDSGLGMSIDKVNELLLLDTPLNDDDYRRMETKNVDINIIKKIVSKMGGYLTIKSEEGRGTEIKIVLDQKIDNESQFEINKLIKKERILIASNDTEYTKNITTLLEKKGYHIENSIYANDVLDRIRLKENFSYIFLDDKLDIRALEVLKKLKEDKKFKIPVIISLDKDMEFIKDHFLEDGFSNYLLKDKVNEELNRLFK